MKDNNNTGEYTKEIKEMEDNAIESYEKGGHKDIRPVEYIRCAICGGKKSLVKTTYDGQDFWFCSECIKERAKELKEAEENPKYIGEM